MNNDFEFRQLAWFRAVAEEKSFTRAAETLGVSQPSLSRAIQKLESQFEQPLFERRPREVVLTEMGEQFFARAIQIISLVNDTFSELAESGAHGTVRVAVIPTIAPYLLPRLLKTFAAANPTVSVVVQEDTTKNIIARCKHGEVDLAILALPVSGKYMEVESLFEEELVLVVPNGHELEKKKTIRLKDVRDFPFVMLDQAHCLSDNIASFCQRQSVEPISIERTSQLATVQELVSLSHGISMVPKMAEVIDNSNRRVYRSFSGDKPTRTIAMLSNPYRFETKWVKLFKNHLRATSKSFRPS